MTDGRRGSLLAWSGIDLAGAWIVLDRAPYWPTPVLIVLSWVVFYAALHGIAASIWDLHLNLGRPGTLWGLSGAAFACESLAFALAIYTGMRGVCA